MNTVSNITVSFEKESFALAEAAISLSFLHEKNSTEQKILMRSRIFCI